MCLGVGVLVYYPRTRFLAISIKTNPLAVFLVSPLPINTPRLRPNTDERGGPGRTGRCARSSRSSFRRGAQVAALGRYIAEHPEELEKTHLYEELTAKYSFSTRLRWAAQVGPYIAIALFVAFLVGIGTHQIYGSYFVWRYSCL